MEIITIERSPTGRHYFRSDAGGLWLGGKREGEAIASFLRVLPRLDRFNPNQPRDARGRFSRTSGTAAAEVPLHKQKVSELHKKLQDMGVDPNILSHKARKSVLVAAIEAKRKGKDLREEGLLKPTKAKSTRTTVKPPKPPVAVEPRLPVRMTGENAIAVHGRNDFKSLSKQWESFNDDLIDAYADQKKQVESTKEVLKQYDRVNPPNSVFVVPSNVALPNDVIKSNRKFYENQPGSISEEVLKDGTKLLSSKYYEDTIASITPGKDGSSYVVRMPEIQERQTFTSRTEAESFAHNYTISILACRVIQPEQISVLRKALDTNQGLKDIESDLKKSGITDLSMENLERYSDNRYIRNSLNGSLSRPEKEVIAIKDKQNNLQSALVYSKKDASGDKPGSLYVDYLATSPWNAVRSNDVRSVSGAGARAIAEAVRTSQNLGFEGRLTLSALEGAVPFYDKLGFVKSPDGLTLPPDKARDLLSKYG